jgi:hypothetical protein
LLGFRYFLLRERAPALSSRGLWLEAARQRLHLGDGESRPQRVLKDRHALRRVRMVAALPVQPSNSLQQSVALVKRRDEVEKLASRATAPMVRSSITYRFDFKSA